MDEQDVRNESKPIVLSVKDLSVSYASGKGLLRAVDGVSFALAEGQTLCLVGESGSGKTSLALAIPKLLPESAVVRGNVGFLERNILTVKKQELYELRRTRISVIFQDAVGSLIPGKRIATQLSRALKNRLSMSNNQDIADKSRVLLESAGLNDYERVLSCYPHELSGGMCQRVMIALALSAEPKLLIADEPLSSLDAITQVRVLNLLFDLHEKYDFAMLYVTHDLRVAARFDSLGVLHHGQLIEYGPTRQLLQAPSAKYTKELLDAVNNLGGISSK